MPVKSIVGIAHAARAAPHEHGMRLLAGLLNFRDPEVEDFRMNLYEAKTPLLGKGGVAAPSRKMARGHLVWRGRGGSSKLPLESIRR